MLGWVAATPSYHSCPAVSRPVTFYANWVLRLQNPPPYNPPGMTVDDTVAGVAAIVAEVRQHMPTTHIQLQAVLPRSHGKPAAPYDSWAALLASLNDGIRSLADDEAVHFIDCTAVFTPITKKLMKDGLHPTVEGAEALASCLLPQLTELAQRAPVS